MVSTLLYCLPYHPLISFFLIDTDVAPLWDPELRTFVGLMTIEDYITVIRLSHIRKMNPLEITSKPISELLITSPFLFQHPEFIALEAEENVLQLVKHLYSPSNHHPSNPTNPIVTSSSSSPTSSFCATNGNPGNHYGNAYSYIPILDPETGSLISMLGKLDILHLLTQIHKLSEFILNVPIVSLPIGTYHHIVTVTKQTLLTEALELCNRYHISALPVVEEGTNGVNSNGKEGKGGKVIGMYHINDISFIMKANDMDMIVTNLTSFTIEDILVLRDQLITSGEMISAHFQSLLTCKSQDSYIHVIQAMVINHSTRVLVLNDVQEVTGIITFQDIVGYFLDDLLC